LAFDSLAPNGAPSRAIKKELVMTKDELQTMNADLISLLTGLRDQIDTALDELGIDPDDDDECIDDSDE
jgi:hypothetical protein